MKKFFLLLFISLFFLSCGDILSPTFDEPVRAYFEEYTNNAAIEKHTFPSGVENPDGILCITCESDGVISFEMRNPQKYLLNFDFDFSESGIKENLFSSDYSFTQASDRAGGTLTFSRDFLNRVDAGNLAGKNISGLITIVEPKSGRSFKSYPISLHANTAPPSVLGAAFQRSSEGDDAKYIVCFFMPNVNDSNMALHTQDTHVIYVNGNKKYTKQGLIYNNATKEENGNWTISDLDSDFSSSAPTMYSLTGETDAFTFYSSKCPAGYKTLYYQTGWPVTTETKTCTLTILDDDGLSSSVAISNKASQLNPPAFSVESSTSYGADEDTGLYAIKITHDGLCTDGSSSGSVTINYTITETEDALVFNNGSASSITSSSAGSATIYLPQGTYTVTATASKNYYITSEEVTKTSVKITQSAVFYVSQNGSDSLNTGKRASPYRTINKAIAAFRDGMLSDLYEDDAECIIYVMSDLTPPDDFTDNTFINIPIISNSIQIIGYGAVRTIDAKGNSSNSRRLLYANFISPSKFTIKNINLKGGYIDNETLNAAVHFYCDFEMIGGSITGCTAERGNVIKVTDGTGLFDGVTISGNKVLTENNSVLYITDSLTLKDSSIINNTAENSAVYLSIVGSLTVSGKVNIYNSKKSDGTAASNLYMPTGSTITVDGNISGSKIGVNVPWQPSDAGAPRIGVPAAFTSGYGYGTTNASLPGEIFIAENGYGISTDSSGEAAFAVSGGGMYTALDYTVNLTASSVKAALNKAKSVTVAVSGTRKEPVGLPTDLYYNNADGKFYTDSGLSTEAAGDNTVTSFAAALYNGATKIADCTVSSASEAGKILVTVPAIAFEDTYTIRVTSTFLGVTKDTSIEYKVISVPEDFVLVAGTTITGSETWTPSSSVFVNGRSLAIPDLIVCDHEITQKEYEAYCKYGSTSPSDTYGKGDNYPAYYVNWYDAVVYCNLRSIAEGLTPAYAISGEKDPTKWSGIVGNATDKYCGPSSTNSTWDGMTFDTTADGYRLPTEAEWEYIAREAGSSSTTYSGSDTIGDVAWYLINSSSKTHEVKGKNANALGIYDMTGNVTEWCWDWKESIISATTSVTGPTSGSYRVLRGGSWKNTTDYNAVSFRLVFGLPDESANTLGFRVVRNAQ